MGTANHSSNHETQENSAGTDLILVLFCSLALAGLSFYLNLHEPSMLTEGDAGWAKRVEFHQVYYPFSVRYFTNGILILAHNLFGLRYVVTFTILQYSLFIVLGPLFAALLRRLGLSRLLTLTGVFFFLSAYPMLAAFHVPVYTYDDYWQYAAVLLAFVLVLDGRLVWAAVAFSAGILAREPTFMFYPVFVLAVFGPRESGQRARWIAAAIPVAVLIAFTWLFGQEPSPMRFLNFAKNFKDAGLAEDTVYSLMAGCGVFWLTALVAAVRLGERFLRNHRTRVILIGAAYTCPVVIAVTLTTTLARETRLFFPPLIFALPLTLLLVQHYASEIKYLFTGWRLPASIVYSAACIWGGIAFSRLLFPQFVYRAYPELAQVHLGIHFGLAAIALTFVTWRLIRISFSLGTSGPAASHPERSKQDIVYATKESNRE